MHPQTLTLSSVGQITLPKNIRNLLGLEKGTKLDVEIDQNRQSITLKKQPTFDEIMAEIDRINAKYPKREIDPKYKKMSVGEMSLELAKDIEGNTWV